MNVFAQAVLGFSLLTSLTSFALDTGTITTSNSREPAPARRRLSQKAQTSSELQTALDINFNYFATREQSLLKKVKAPVSGKPVLETDKFQYLLMNGDDLNEEQIQEMHRIIAQNLPPGISLVVVTESDEADTVRNTFLQWLPEDRLIVASGDNLGDTVWGRDSYPYPVYKDDSGQVELIGHRYFRQFSAQQLIAESVRSINLENHNFVYVGGNITATEKGDCFAVNSDRIFGLPDETFTDVFRCKTITRLPFQAGIGDVDEVIKVLPNGHILTNQKIYRKTLEKMGYQVTMLPEIADTYRTYANSVILGNTIFMPSYDDPRDFAAAKIYESFGYKVIMIPSSFLSDEMTGSLHCLTMTYPAMNLSALLGGLGLRSVR